MPKLKPETLIPDRAEDESINAGINADTEARELDREWFKRARPAREVLGEENYHALLEMKRPRGRPPASATKIFTGVRLDADVLNAFKTTGKGWQTRMNAALRLYLEEHPFQ